MLRLMVSTCAAVFRLLASKISISKEIASTGSISPLGSTATLTSKVLPPLSVRVMPAGAFEPSLNTAPFGVSVPKTFVARSLISPWLKVKFTVPVGAFVWISSVDELVPAPAAIAPDTSAAIALGGKALSFVVRVVTAISLVVAPWPVPSRTARFTVNSC